MDVTSANLNKNGVMTHRRLGFLVPLLFTIDDRTSAKFIRITNFNFSNSDYFGSWSTWHSSYTLNNIFQKFQKVCKKKIKPKWTPCMEACVIFGMLWSLKGLFDKAMFWSNMVNAVNFWQMFLQSLDAFFHVFGLEMVIERCEIELNHKFNVIFQIFKN